MNPIPFADAAVRDAFASHPPPMRAALLHLRHLVYASVAEHPEIGEVMETLKWGDPSWLPKTPRIGATVRINAIKNSSGRYAAYFHCRTNLLTNFRDLYPGQFRFEGNRALIFSLGERIPEAPLRHCFALALTYHLRQGR